MADPVSVLTQRASYARTDLDAFHPGYSVALRELLHMVKGFRNEFLDYRRGIIEKTFRKEPAADYGDVDKEFAALKRPVAIYFPAPSGYLRWLQKNGRGRAVWKDGPAVIWLLEPDNQD